MFAGRIGRQIVLLQIMWIIILDTQGFQYFPTIPDFMDAEKQLSLPDLIMEIGKEQNCSLVVDPWQYYKFEFSSVDNRDLTKLRWQWRLERQKSNKFNNQNNNCTCITLFCTFISHMKPPNFMRLLYGVAECNTKIFFSFFYT